MVPFFPVFDLQREVSFSENAFKPMPVPPTVEALRPTPLSSMVRCNSPFERVPEMLISPEPFKGSMPCRMAFSNMGCSSITGN